MIYCLLGSIILIPCGIIRSLELPRFMAVLLEILAGGVVYTAGAGLYLYLGEKNLLLFLGRYWRVERDGKKWDKQSKILANGIFRGILGYEKDGKKKVYG